MKVNKVFGPPGTGKTTFLLNKVEEALASGTYPHEIGFFSFTNKAADEAKFRALVKFPWYAAGEFRYFRTLHSLALESIGGAASFTTMGKDDWNFIGSKLGLTFTGASHKLWDETLNWDGVTLGDKVRALCDLARLRGCSLKEAWRRSDIEGVSLPEIERFAKALQIYKNDRGMIDFCDMLEMACKSESLPSYKLLIIDEAQDLSSLQWDLVGKLVEKAESVYIAGDDDQAIFQWAGADVQRFIAFPGKPVVLEQSYRVPISVSIVAGELQEGIKGRVDKKWRSRPEVGEVQKHHEFDPKVIGLEEGEWLILVRNNYQIRPVVDLCVDQGYWFFCKMSSIRAEALPAARAWELLRVGERIPLADAKLVYSFMGSGTKVKHGSKAKLDQCEWEDITMEMLHDQFGLIAVKPWWESLDKLLPQEISYLRACRRRGEKLLKEPRIKISTIHGAKGGEADNVLILTDYSRATDSNADRFPSDEHRVWYVGVTRARKSLHILMPQTNTYFKPLAYAKHVVFP